MQVSFRLRMILVIQLVNKDIVSFIFGNKWGDATEYIKILSFWFGIQFVSSSLSCIYARLRKLKAMMFFDLTHVILIAASIWGGNYVWGTPEKAMQMLVLVKVLFYALVFVLALKFIRDYKEDLDFSKE